MEFDMKGILSKVAAEIAVERTEKAVEASLDVPPYRGSGVVEKTLYEAPRMHDTKLSKFTQKQMAKKKKRTTKHKGSRHYETRRRLGRETYYRHHEARLLKQKKDDCSVYGRWKRIVRYMNAKPCRASLGVMSLDEWEKLWRKLPLYKGETPMSELRAKYGKLPRVYIERIDTSKGMFVDNVIVVLQDVGGNTIVYDGNKTHALVV